MVAVDEAKRIIAANIKLRISEKVLLSDAVGFVLAEDFCSDYNVPSFDNSAMDGYAFRFGEGIKHLEIIDFIEAGKSQLPLVKEGQAVRIFTGAPIPPGTDTVVQQEFVSATNTTVTFDINLLQRGANVRKAGAQSLKGAQIAKKGSVITPGLAALLASVGFSEVNVYSPPSVAVITTGNELQEPGTPLLPFRIYNSNATSVQAYLRLLGIRTSEIFFAEDKPEEIKRVTVKALEKFDVVILSGGISVGDYDFVRDVLKSLEVTELFYKVKQKPGKPLMAGVKDDKWIFALPGNPAAVLTCFNQYVKPCIKSQMGFDNAWNPTYILPLKSDYLKKGSLTHFLKVRVNDNQIEILPGQESFNLLSFSEADGFVELPGEKEHFEKGTLVKFYSW